MQIRPKHKNRPVSAFACALAFALSVWLLCRPGYEALLKVLQEEGMSVALLQLADQAPHRAPTAPPQHPTAGIYQQPYGPPPTAAPQDPHRNHHTPHGWPQQPQGAGLEGGVQRGVQGGSAAWPSSAAPVVKREDQGQGGTQGVTRRQQVYAHDVPFNTIATLQPVSFTPISLFELT